MNSIQNTACLIAAYETAAGCRQRPDHPDRWYMEARVTGSRRRHFTGRHRPAGSGDQPTLHKRGEALIDQMRTLCCPGAVRETRCSLPPQNPMAVLGDFALRGGVIQSIDPERKTCSVQGRFFPMDDVPLHYVLGRYDLDLHETHYGVPCVQPLMGEHPELAERYLREAEARWNTQYGPPAASSEAPKNTMQAMGGMS